MTKSIDEILQLLNDRTSAFEASFRVLDPNFAPQSNFETLRSVLPHAHAWNSYNLKSKPGDKNEKAAQILGKLLSSDTPLDQILEEYVTLGDPPVKVVLHAPLSELAPVNIVY